MENQRISETQLQHMLNGYIAAALWSSTDEEQEPLDSKYSQDSLSEQTLQSMKADCSRFANTHFELIEEFQAVLARDDWSFIGHDFWLTRNGHGAGFWDRVSKTQSDVGVRLSAYCGYDTEFRPVDLYVGDDGKLHLA